MGEYLVNKNSLGKTGLSYKSIGQIAIDAANSVTGVTADEKLSYCRLYGEKIKINLVIKVDENIDHSNKCHEVDEEVRNIIAYTLDIENIELHVSAGK